MGKRTKHLFDTLREAQAFAAGIDFVNDSALSRDATRGRPGVGYYVITEDEDGEGHDVRDSRDRYFGREEGNHK